VLVLDGLGRDDDFLARHQIQRKACTAYPIDAFLYVLKIALSRKPKRTFAVNSENVIPYRRHVHPRQAMKIAILLFPAAGLDCVVLFASVGNPTQVDSCSVIGGTIQERLGEGRGKSLTVSSRLIAPSVDESFPGIRRGRGSASSSNRAYRRSPGGGKPVASHLGISSFSVLGSITVFWKCAIFQMPSRLTIVKEALVLAAAIHE